jgi:peptide/nickel transport system permease protein
MATYIVKRLAYSALTVVVVLVAVFAIVHVIPGDPARILLGQRATNAAVREERAQLGLDKSLPEQFGLFVTHAVHGDFGTSITYDEPAFSLVMQRLPATLFLVAYTAILAVLVGVPLGIIAALRRNRAPDHVIGVAVLIAISIPSFWLGTLLVLTFSLHLQWLPSSGYGVGLMGHVRSLLLPALAMAPWMIAFVTRNLRGAVIDVLRLPYVDFARMQGLKEATVLGKYILRNSFTSTVTLLGINVALLFSGSVVVENVFSIPGTGSLLLDAVQSRDYAVIQAITLVYALLAIAINLLTDLLYPVLDPRVTVQ